MDLFKTYVRNQPWSIVCELETHEDEYHRKYGFLITKLLWHAVHLYIAFPLIIEPDSPLSKAYNQSGFFPDADYKYNLNGKLIIDIVRHQTNSKSSHITLSGARSAVNSLRQRLTTMNFSDLYPEHWKHFKKFCSSEASNSLKDIIEKKFINVDNLKIISHFDFESREWKDIFTKTPFEGNNQLRCQERIAVEFHHYKFIFVYDRIYYFTKTRLETEIQTDSEGRIYFRTSTRIDKFYNYLQKLRLFGYNKNGAPVKIKEACDLDLNIFENFFKKNWSEVFDINSLYEVLIRTIIHKHNWKNINQEIQNDLLKFGSVLLVERYKGAYFHAGVYLGDGKVIHISADFKTIRTPQKYFKVQTISEFANNDKKIHEVRLLIPKYSPNELLERASNMSEKDYCYSVDKNNCEHLAFELVIGKKMSQQVQGLKRLKAKLFDSFIVSGGSVFS